MLKKRKPNRERLIKRPATIYLEPGQAAALARLHERTRVPTAVYLREAVDMLLAKYEREAA